MMKRIVITLPYFTPGEGARIASMLADGGAARVHIRKPAADEASVAALVEEVPAHLRTRLSVHYFPAVAARYGCGLHLNSRVPAPPAGFSGTLSRSCHSLDELRDLADVDYAFLSPVFDSISKVGYRSAFTSADLADAAARGLIGPKVYALGGVDPSKFALLQRLGFGGAALLGAAWAPVDPVAFSLQYITQGDTIDDICRGAQGALDGGCRWVQLRMKDASDDAVVEAAARLRPLCEAVGATFILDDRVGLVERTGAHGVHLGKNDMPVDEALGALGPGYIVGATANTFADIEAAAARGAHYIGLGPLRFTTTKKNLSPVLGYEGYADICAHCRRAGITLPVVAIGGITGADIEPLAMAGAAGVAVSGSIARAGSPAEASRLLITEIRKHII